MAEEVRGIPYADQCILVEGIDHFISLKGTKLKKGYKNFGMLAPSKMSPSLFLNLLTSNTSGQVLLENIPKSIFADLKPYVRIYKEYNVNSSKDPIKVLLPFGNIVNVGAPSKPKLGVALRSFTYDYLGTHPGEIDYFINCNLKLYFESVDALFKKRRSPKKGFYSFADLIDRTPMLPMKGQNAHKQWNPKAFKIRAEIGYEPPSRDRVIQSMKSGQWASKVTNLDYNVYADTIRKAIASAKISFFLTIKKHTFKPLTNSPAGDFELTIEYNGAIEQSLLTNGADVIKTDPDPEVAKKLDRLMENEYSVRQVLSDQKIVTNNQQVQMLADVNHEMQLMDQAIPKEFGEDADRQALKKAIAETGEDVVPDMLQRLSNRTFQNPEKYSEVRDQLLHDYQTTLLKKALKRDTSSGGGFIESGGLLKGFFGDQSDNKLSKAFEKQKIEEARGYLKTLKQQTDFESTHRASVEMRLSDAYSMWVRKLASQGLIYTYILDSNQVHQWQNDRTSRKAPLNEKQKEDHQKKLDDPNVNAAEKRVISQKLNNNKSRVSNSNALIVNMISRKNTKPSVFRASEVTALNKELGSAVADQSRKKKGLETGGSEKSFPRDDNPTHALNWMYFGDILDATLDFVVSNRHSIGLDLWSAEHNPKGKVKVLVGSYEYIDPVSFSKKRINIADIPISLDLWNEFVNKTMVSSLKEKYPFKVFLKDLLTDLVQGALTNKCKLPGQPSLGSRFAVDYVSIPDARKFNFYQSRAGTDQSWYYDHKNVLSLRNDAELEKSRVATQYEGDVIYIFSTDSSAKEAMRGNKSVDNSNGIYHLVLGQEGTPVLDIDFTRSDQPHFLTGKAEREGLAKGSHFLSEPYHCNVTLYGNTEFRPGKYLYIRFAENYMSTREAQRLGIGGYFFIVKTSNEISQVDSMFQWTSKLECRWEKPLGGKYLASREAEAVPEYSEEEFETKPAEW